VILDYYWYSIADIKGVDDEDYNPLSGSAKFGSFLFSIGSFLLVLAACRSFYAMDLQIIYNFESITSIQGDSPSLILTAYDF
jgi:hypothetical protein